MRNIISFFIITLFVFGLVITDASAKRFGGGRSFGINRSSSSYSNSYTKPSAASSSNTLSQRFNSSKWGGMLGGLLIGGLLASLFMHNGLAGGLLSWLAVGVLVFLVVNFFRRRMQSGFQSGQNFQTAPSTQSFGQNFQPSQNDLFRQTPMEAFKNPLETFKSGFMNNQDNTTANNTMSYPIGFEVDAFLRDAKVKFIRLQAAYDQKNLTDLREFTSPEVLAEIKLQLQERGDDVNQTDVVTLDAQLLDVSTEPGSSSASVQFSGLIKENQNQPEQFSEIWHFSKTHDSDTWLVSGVQQP